MKPEPHDRLSVEWCEGCGTLGAARPAAQDAREIQQKIRGLRCPCGGKVRSVRYGLLKVRGRVKRVKNDRRAA